MYHSLVQNATPLSQAGKNLVLRLAPHALKQSDVFGTDDR